MTSALIGHTGFVGSNLAAQARFDETYNSRDIDRIAGRAFDLVVCAGVYAVKWKANQEPEADRAALERLVGPLRSVEAKRFVLISTVDVYPRPRGVDEDTIIDPAAASPYGRHRFELESFVRDRFRDSTVLRLPGLFGPGLKKNVIFDLLHDHRVDQIHPEGVFQYYGLRHLWGDLQKALERRLPLLNLACEPLPTRELSLRVFGRELPASASPAPEGYDLRSKHAPLWGGAPSGYLYSKEQVLRELAGFVEEERSR